MSFWEVEWSPEAEIDMGRLLSTASDRSELLAAMKTIEAGLERHPSDMGESRTTDHRIIIEPPLAIYCAVLNERLRVEIYAAWRWGE